MRGAGLKLQSAVDLSTISDPDVEHKQASVLDDVENSEGLDLKRYPPPSSAFISLSSGSA